MGQVYFTYGASFVMLHEIYFIDNQYIAFYNLNYPNPSLSAEYKSL